MNHETRKRRELASVVWACAVLTTMLAGSAARGAGEANGTAPPDFVVAINTAAPSKEYSRMLFGGFLEHFHRQVYGGVFDPGSPLADARGFRKDVIEAMKELKVAVVRWPGGCFASGYHWQDGVGPERKPVADPVWGVTDPNTFGTDEFVLWCRLIGAEPYICTNAGNGTPEEMKQWVAYCNATEGQYAELRKANGHEKPFNVKYWSIGNENYGHWEIGRKTPQKWGPLVHQCAELMRSVDPSIKLAAAAWQAKREWNLPLLAAAGDDLDLMAVHHYWLPLWRKHEMPPYHNCVKFSDGPEKSIAAVIAVIEEAGYRGKIKIAYDEWNLRAWHHPGFPRKRAVGADDTEAVELIAKRDLNALPEQYTMADALFTASFLNACLRHCEDVGMANIAPIVNTRGPLYVHPKGIVKRTHFHTLAMYANELEPRVAELTIEPDRGNPVNQIDAIATVDADGGAWAIALVNRHPSNQVTCAVKLGDRMLNGAYDATILAGDSPEAFNNIEHPDRVAPEKRKIEFADNGVTLPPHSLTIVRVR